METCIMLISLSQRLESPMDRHTAIRLAAIALIASGITAYLTVAIAESTSYTIVQCVDYPAGAVGSNAGCHEVSNNTPQILKPIMNEGFKTFSISLLSTGVVVLVVAEAVFRRKRITGTIPENC